MTESRTELVIWVNDLLHMQYTKVEQLGTGVAYAQIIDSIYGDVHLAKIKFFAKHEYEYIDNYKVLQRSFEKHKIDKIIPVERLIKCRFQDNLEFLQWIKQYWSTNYQGQTYNAVGRRQKGINKAAAILSTPPPSRQMIHGRLSNQGFLSDMASCTSLSTTSSSTAATTALGSPVDNIGGGGVGYYNYGRTCQSPSSSSTLSFDNNTKRTRIHALTSPRSSPSPASSQVRIIADLRQQLTQLEATAKSLYTERNFYFNKLESIERVLERSGVLDTASKNPPFTLDKIHDIVFNTGETL